MKERRTTRIKLDPVEENSEESKLWDEGPETGNALNDRSSEIIAGSKSFEAPNGEILRDTTGAIPKSNRNYAKFDYWFDVSFHSQGHILRLFLTYLDIEILQKLTFCRENHE